MKPLSERDENGYIVKICPIDYNYRVGMKPLSERDENIKPPIAGGVLLNEE